MNRLLLKIALFCLILLGSAAHAQDAAAAPATPEATKSEEEIRWYSLVAPKYKTWPPLEYVKEDPALPRALLIGDSISVGYTTRVRKQLEGKVNLHRIPVNGGSTVVGLENLDQWLSWRDHWDVIHFNFGLHDLSHEVDGKLDLAGPYKVPLEQYSENLEKIVLRLKETGAVLIWATTTPVPEGAAGRIPGDEIVYNAAAEKIMKKHGIRILDLYTFIKPHLAVAQPPADVHFKDEGNDMFAPLIAGEILKGIEESRAAAKKKESTSAK